VRIQLDLDFLTSQRIQLLMLPIVAVFSMLNLYCRGDRVNIVRQSIDHKAIIHNCAILSAYTITSSLVQDPSETDLISNDVF
jgi:hypothetical protein